MCCAPYSSIPRYLGSIAAVSEGREEKSKYDLLYKFRRLYIRDSHRSSFDRYIYLPRYLRYASSLSRVVVLLDRSRYSTC